MQTDTVAPPARRIKELEVMVADVVVETPDTSTLVLFTGNDRLDYKAGHFLTIDPHQFAWPFRTVGTRLPILLRRSMSLGQHHCRSPCTITL